MNGIVWLMCNWWVSISFLKYCQNCMHHLSFCLTKMVVESFDFACFFAAHYIPPKKRVPQSEYRRYWYLDCAFVLMQDFGCFSRGLVPLQVEVNPLSYHSTTCPSFVLFFSRFQYVHAWSFQKINCLYGAAGNTAGSAFLRQEHVPWIAWLQQNHVMFNPPSILWMWNENAFKMILC